jgi:DNA-binding transcriptional MerR regulator
VQTIIRKPFRQHTNSRWIFTKNFVGKRINMIKSDLHNTLTVLVKIYFLENTWCRIYSFFCQSGAVQVSYTVNKLAKLSGVSVRTLHFYDEIGLLKPAYYGDNKYRYYEEEQLLMLQQILFYRELGVPLNDIQKILQCESFDKIEALKSHKNILISNLERMQNLIKTIDKTITHLRGESTMKDNEFYYGFDSEKQKGYETPEFSRFYDHYNPKILKFLVEAIKIFAEKELE